MKAKVLIIDDEEAIRSSLKMILEYEGYECVLAANGEAGLKIAERESPDLVFLDIKMPQMDGMEVLKRLKAADGSPPVVMISGHADVATAFEASKLAAFDFIEKPLESERVLVAARNALREKTLEKENRRLKLLFDDKYRMVGRSASLDKVGEAIKRAAPTNATVLIVGESGVGKELVARAIHASSRRWDRKFVSENCGTIAESLLESELFGHMKGAFTGADEDRPGLFEAAQGGTVFLDEIGDMSEGMQRKLLRVLQEGVIRPIGSQKSLKVDVRVISASNRNLPALVQKGAFRIDLFYRMNVISLELPPLRERVEDMPLLVDHFLDEIAHEDGQAKRLSESAMNALRQYAWPGNVRELRNVIRRVVVTSKERTIVRKDVAPLLTGSQTTGFLSEDLDRTDTHIVLRVPRKKTFHEIIGECERVVLQSALKECRWNKSRVVKLLKIPRQSLYNMIAKHNLTRKWE